MNFYIDEIISIEEVETDSLRYDIEVEDNHNFFANGILVHNCQNLKKEIQRAYDNDVEFEVTIKLDGSSMSVGMSPDGDYTVCSRNINLKTDQEGNAYVDMAKSLGLEEKLAGKKNIMISGELIGLGLNGNHENISYQDFYVFDVFDVEKGSYVSNEERYKIVEELGLKHVPILHKKVTLRELGLDSLEKILDFAEGPSLFAKYREGVVFKAVDGKYSFKAVSNSYLIKKGG